MLWLEVAEAIRRAATDSGADASPLAVSVYAEPTRTLPAGRAIVITAGAPWLEASGVFGGAGHRLRAVCVVPASTDDRLGSLYRLVQLVIAGLEHLEAVGWQTVEQPVVLSLPDGVEILAATVNLSAAADPAAFSSE